MRRVLERLAESPGSAILLVSLVSLTASWINWGFGLVVGVLFDKAIARKVRVDYRLLVTSAYSGFIVWHGGLAGSVPLAIATSGHPFKQIIGIIPTDRTIFAAYNLFIAVPLVNRMMMPKKGEEVFVDPELLVEPEPPEATGTTPAERMETSRVLSCLIGPAGLAFLFQYFAGTGTLTLKIVKNGSSRFICSSLDQKRLLTHNCSDNSAVESFLKSLKAEVVWRRDWHVRRDVEIARFQYINGF